MEKLKQRLGKNNAIDNVLNDRHVDDQEQELADDTDAFTNSASSELEVDISLRLKLSESSNSVHEKNCSGVYNEESKEIHVPDFDSENPMSGRTVFEIISTDTIKDGHSNFVIYRILLTKSSIVDPNPVVVERRYSDFQLLHQNLHKHFNEQMDVISFPKKRLFGNFTPKTIAKRSRAFEQYLTHLYTIDEIRFSQVFLDFFCLADLKEAYNSMLDVEYEKAITCFQKVLLIQEKILGFLNLKIGETLCALVSCCQTVEDDMMGLKYGRQALKCYANHEENKYYLPLLQSCVHLCWKTGEDKAKLEEILNQRKRDSKDLPSLLSVVHSSVIL
ncbi:sorting nexin-20-like [Ruditapes philippinarum]|uniref:sorting nexin-20-like n=1 Tax=Ruditapes philippinarum TaxID=129788 RepID=UPI00295AA1A7|nr:sorting nexin-20-like [Ruditapes philippinarum]